MHKIVLGKEIDILPGYPFNSKLFSEETGIPLIRIRDLSTHISNTYFIGAFSTAYLIQKGDILIGMDGDFNIVKWKGIPSLLNQRILKIYRKQKSGVDINYIFYRLQPLLLVINSRTAATTVKHLSTYDISDLELKVPSLPHQRKIAAILSTVDAQIEKTEAIIAKYQAIKQGVLYDLFTRGIDITTGKLRPAFKDAPDLYKDSPLGMIPKEWESVRLGTFADENVPYSFTGGPFGSDLQTKHYVASGVRIIQLQNIGDGTFLDDYKIFTTEEKATQLISCNIYPGEIIIAKMAEPVARACIMPYSSKRFLMASDGIRLSVNKEMNNTKFVMEMINSNFFRSIVISRSTGTTRSRIGLTELREIYVKRPEIDEQNKMAEFLEGLDEKILNERNTNAKYKLLKQGLMSDLLSGKVEVTIKETATV